MSPMLAARQCTDGRFAGFDDGLQTAWFDHRWQGLPGRNVRVHHLLTITRRQQGDGKPARLNTYGTLRLVPERGDVVVVEQRRLGEGLENADGAREFTIERLRVDTGSVGQAMFNDSTAVFERAPYDKSAEQSSRHHGAKNHQGEVAAESKRSRRQRESVYVGARGCSRMGSRETIKPVRNARRHGPVRVRPIRHDRGPAQT